MEIFEEVLSTELKEIIKVPLRDVKNLSELKNYEFDNRYIADRTGKIYRLKYTLDNYAYCVLMSPFITRDGYVEYVLTSSKGIKKHIQGQRIIADLFIPHDPKRQYVNHKNLNRSDNRVENLEWVTHSENILHSWANRKNKK